MNYCSELQVIILLLIGGIYRNNYYHKLKIMVSLLKKKVNKNQLYNIN